eukprot:GHVL01014304.1.p1 GENE.GHVL01014304.1~~GHVL01014304.1.p1  ORF type:complete len:136 (+),score=14.71 GHVL01014304.1:82-489(+)
MYLSGEIMSIFCKKGFRLVACKLMEADTKLLEEHYGDLKSKSFFPTLVKFMSSGPLLCMVYEGKNVVKVGRKLLGATDPADSEPGTIRGDYAIDIGRNVCHGSDSVESAKKEIALWFKPNELISYNMSATSDIYE